AVHRRGPRTNAAVKNIRLLFGSVRIDDVTFTALESIGAAAGSLHAGNLDGRFRAETPFEDLFDRKSHLSGFDRIGSSTSVLGRQLLGAAEHLADKNCFGVVECLWRIMPRTNAGVRDRRNRDKTYQC